MKVLIIGSNGLIGSEAVSHYNQEGHEVYGIDSHTRREFFGPQGDTRWNLERLRQTTRHFHHCELDIHDRQRILDLFKSEKFDLIIHCAAQPSPDKAKDIPFVNFDGNAVGTVWNAFRKSKHSPARKYTTPNGHGACRGQYVLHQ